MTASIDILIKEQFKKTLKETNLSSLGKLYRGKVRDNYTKDNIRIIIATDRISSFDRVITTVPFKGQMLNQVSAFWFNKTKDIANNHIVDVPDPNVSIVKQCETVPIEMIIRAYITGTMWRQFQKGEATSGIMPRSDIRKNEKFDDLVVTPSTKAKSGHDVYLPKKVILKESGVSEEIYDEMEEIALKLFKFGQEYCQKNGLILVDTKYEFGINDGVLTVIDEIHTQDSSRFWMLDSYDKLFSEEKDPEILDKEIFRGWLMDTYPDIFPDIKPDQEIPPIDDDIKVELTKRYIKSYEMVTGDEFKPEIGDVKERIESNLKNAGYI